MVHPQACPAWLIPFSLVSLALFQSFARGDEKPLREIIDAEVRQAWEREKIAPAGKTDDAAFVRRVYLDLAGAIPTYEETTKFRADADPNKRAKLIDRLLDDPRFAAHQSDVWDLTLFGRKPPGGDTVRKRDDFKKWLTGKFAANEGYDKVVRELLLGEQDGSEMFLVQFRNQPEDATVAVSRLFLGMQLQCARCHDHPFANWTQRDFYGMAGFFVRLVVQDGSGPKKRFRIGEKSTGEVLFTGAVKDQKPGQKGEPVKPKFLGGAVLDEPPAPKGFKEQPAKTKAPLPRPAFSRKEKLTAWLVSPENPYFAQAAVNRVWAQFMGRGIVQPVDDFDGRNKPSHPELLKALSSQFTAHRFDLKWLIRELVNSNAYQLSSKGGSKDAMPHFFERGRVRPVSAEELITIIRSATGATASGMKSVGEETYIMLYFGEPMNGQGEFQGSLSEHLFMNNSSHIRQLIAQRKGNLADQVLTSKDPWETRVDRMFLTVLSRPPNAEERKRFVAHLTSEPMSKPLVEQAIWVLVCCSEFRFNH